MPIVTVRALADGARDVPRAASAVSIAIARAAGIPESDVYVVWQEVAAGTYVIGTAVPTRQPLETHPPLVEISARSGRPPETREAIMRAAADSVAQGTGVPPTNVRVLYLEAPPGTIFGRGRIQ